MNLKQDREGYLSAIAKKRVPRRYLAAFLLSTTSAVVNAQDYDTTMSAMMTDAFPVVDHNGVDLTTGFFHINSPMLSVGSAENNFSFGLTWLGQSWQPNIPSIWKDDDGSIYASIGAETDKFNYSNGNWKPTKANGAQLNCLTYDGHPTHVRQCIYNSHLGAVSVFSNSGSSSFTIGAGNLGMDNGVNSVSAPNSGEQLVTQSGSIVIYTYRGFGATFNVITPASSINIYEAIVNNPTTTPTAEMGKRISSISVSTPNLTGSNVDYNNNVLRPKSVTQTFTDSDNHVWSYSFDNDHNMTSFKTPSDTVSTATIVYDGHRVTHYTNAYGTWIYDYDTSGSVYKTTITNPDHTTRVVAYIKNKGYARWVTDELLRTTNYSYDDGKNFLIGIEYPNHNAVTYGYDTCGNLNSIIRNPLTGSGDVAITASATYGTACGSNYGKPVQTVDGRQNQTDYEYGSGGITKITRPVDANGIRPEVRYTYIKINPTITLDDNTLRTGNNPSSGATVPSTISKCRTSAACTGTTDETFTTYDYGVVDGSQQNLVYARTITTESGNCAPGGTGACDPALQAIEKRTYDTQGNILTSDGPLPGTVDTYRYVYDFERNQTISASPDPDGSGGLGVEVAKTAYNGEGKPTSVTEGSATDQSDTALANMTVLRQTTTHYDAGLQKDWEKVAAASGSVLTLTQFAYDNFGRLACTATRMDPTTFGSTSTAACSVEQSPPGSYGWDRITHNMYDSASELLKVQTGYGTSTPRDYTTTAYTLNGKTWKITDANGNLTTYAYDSFDRLKQTNYPSPTQAGQSSTTDYETITHDANANITAHRLRDGSSLGFTFDALNRMATKGGSEIADVSYTYDLQNHPLTSKFSSNSQGSTNTYDALGRVTISSDNMGGTSRSLLYTYDAAGDRIQIKHPDGQYYTYDYDYLRRVSYIHDTTGNTRIAIYYDNFGRRSSIARDNSAPTSYSFDALDRLYSLTQDMYGTTYDETEGMAYDAASEIGTQTRSNDAYIWNSAYNHNTAYAPNGLNQYGTVGGGTYNYDQNGNLHLDGTNTYLYDGENRLTSAAGPGSANLGYDPQGRLWQVTSNGVSTRILYDGDERVLEYDSSGSILRRYVHGPGVDEPLLWLEGSTLNDRRFFHADHQGSIIAVTDTSGLPLSINTYDEYGNPGLLNRGRFQYTGQVWLGEIGLAYYKARMYSPALGRFLQTDPSGYKNDLNWYSYADNNPASKFDSTGKAAFLVARRIEAGLASHMFVVISDKLGGAITSQYSYTHTGSTFDALFGGSRLIGVGSNSSDVTNVQDRAAWQALSDSKSAADSGVSYTTINAPDSVVKSVGDYTDSVLATGGVRYDINPMANTQSGDSNTAAYHIAQSADRISGSGEQALPPNQNPIGYDVPQNITSIPFRSVFDNWSFCSVGPC